MSLRTLFRGRLGGGGMMISVTISAAVGSVWAGGGMMASAVRACVAVSCSAVSSA